MRGYMRQFFAYGFRSRDEFDAKSARSYDNEKRRVESWLGDYMSFRHDTNGKAVFLSVDSRRIPNNPFYKAWKASSFTKNDIGLHFILLDILADGKPKTMIELLEAIDSDYISAIHGAEPIDESTLRKKLKEYIECGLLVTKKQGKKYRYSLPETTVNLKEWQDAIEFFSEDNPLGVIGSFLQDKADYKAANFFTFKHRYLLFSIDSGILLELLTAIRGRQKIEMEFTGSDKGGARRAVMIPLKIFQSVQGGRQYLAAYSVWKKNITFFRVDRIKTIKQLEIIEDYEFYQDYLKIEQPKIWGAATGQGATEHIEMTLIIEPQDIHIVHRLEREKRCGKVEDLGHNRWRFSADVYDAREMTPWLRTFIGRIASLVCSNKKVEEQFWMDYSTLAGMYKDDDSAV